MQSFCRNKKTHDSFGKLRQKQIIRLENYGKHLKSRLENVFLSKLRLLC